MKMNRPEVEAVRFRGGIDVIATNGTPLIHEGSALMVTSNDWYLRLYTNGREANQRYPGLNYSTDSYYELVFDDTKFKGLNPIDKNNLNGYYYAWYNDDDDDWWTAYGTYPNAIEYDR